LSFYVKQISISTISIERSLTKSLVKFTSLISVLLAGCASPSEVLKDGIKAKFESAKTAPGLASCIDRNADDYARGSLRSKVVNSGTEPIEVRIRNGNFIYAVVQVTTAQVGSSARFRFGGIAILPQASLEAMTKNCE
jgi:hypothetical protein